MKNYEAPTLARALGPILLLATRRIVQQTIVRRGTPFARALAPFSPSCRRGRTRARRRLGWNAPDVYEPEPPDAQATDGTCAAVIRRLPVESLAAVGSALAATPDVAVTRREVQARRVVPDAQLLPHFGRALERDSNLRSYTDAQDALVEALNLRRLFEGRTRVLIITHEPLRPNMSGPGVRALEMGRGLSRSVSVTVATPYPPEINDDRCTLAPYTYRDASTLRTLAEQCDLIVARGFTLSQFPFLTGLDVPIVLDLYCPFTLEHLEMTSPEAKKAPERMDAVSAEAADILAIQNNQLHHGDFFICATERQRDFWLGTLHTAGRINPLNYGQDPSLRSLIDVVPFGLPDAPPATDGPRALKGVHPGIRTTDHVLLWGGSVLDWQDPQIIIRAVAQLARERDDVKLFFMG
ncbi:MAG TPA: hypothetical protein QGF05_00995, partial [Dehalococcoidia bacterium]|nr:hypothetical protein [Dehalococcoidia bacterium]